MERSIDGHGVSNLAVDNVNDQNQNFWKGSLAGINNDPKVKTKVTKNDYSSFSFLGMACF